MRRFWLAGTAGAFLSSLARTIPADFVARTSPPLWPYIWDAVLRYGYMFWFLIYFAIAAFNTVHEAAEKSTLWDIVHDLGQSTVALLAIYCLGFVSKDKPGDPVVSIVAANAAIFFICALAWVMFKSWKALFGWISLLRLCGALLSLAGLISGCVRADLLRAYRGGSQLWIGVLLALLWLVLIRYGFLRSKEPDLSTTVTEEQPAAPERPSPPGAKPQHAAKSEPAASEPKAPTQDGNQGQGDQGNAK